MATMNQRTEEKLENCNILDSQEDSSDSDDVSNDEKHMAETIAQAPPEIRSILSIFKDSYINDVRGKDSRQLDYSVLEFIKNFRNVDCDNFYALKMEETIKDARCFFMILKQLNPRTSRKVSTNPLIHLCYKLYMYPAMQISFLHHMSFLHTQDSIWKLPEGQESVTVLTSAKSPFKTFVLDLISTETTDAKLKKLGLSSKKKLQEYASLFYKKLQEKLQQTSANAMVTTVSPSETQQVNQKLGSTSSMQDTSIGNTTTSFSQTSTRQQIPNISENLSSSAVEETVETSLNINSCISPISMSYSQNSAPYLNVSSDSIRMALDDGTSDNMSEGINLTEENEENNSIHYSPLLYLQNRDDSYSFSGDYDANNSTVPMAKPFHKYVKEDLQPVQCMASFLYLVFRDPLAHEVSFFKAGFRAFGEYKQEYQQAIMENKRRYVTSYGPGTKHYR